MKYLLSCMALLLAACNVNETITTDKPSADFAEIFEYTPAPGQFINDTILAGFNEQTTPEGAAAYAEQRLRNRYYVSLGGWGGYIVAGFAAAVVNDGGYNLLIGGNQIAASSEPGIVWVMRDENSNSLPDDTWYELKGAADAVHHYEVTYHRPEADGDPVAWDDNKGASGTIDRTIEHLQAYYPAWITSDSYTLRGTRLPDNIELSGNLWIARPFEWGYVDNYSAQGRNLFRISDAVDAEGNPMSISEIHFVKIQTGVFDQAPLIGEISTEVCSICNYNLLK